MPETRSNTTVALGVDLDHPSVARVYDYLLEGTANWAVDREFGERAVQVFPMLKSIALANRLFLNRVVRHLANLGIRQFLDIGPIVPAVGSTHQVADEIAPDTRVVYADNEPVSVAHAEVLLDHEGDPDRHAVINADLHDPVGLWGEAIATGIIDPYEPVAVLMIDVLQVVHPGPDGNDDACARTVACYRDLMPEGSYLGISHVTYEGVPPEFPAMLKNFRRLCEAVNSRMICRTQPEIEALFGDFEIIKPGMVWIPQWHPEQDPDAWTIPPNHAVMWAGVGRKPRRARGRD